MNDIRDLISYCETNVAPAWLEPIGREFGHLTYRGACFLVTTCFFFGETLLRGESRQMREDERQVLDKLISVSAELRQVFQLTEHGVRFQNDCPSELRREIVNIVNATYHPKAQRG